MPAYARDGSVLCFFRPAPKFSERYATFGFNDNAKLDDGTMWPVAYALKKLTKADEARIAALIKKRSADSGPPAYGSSRSVMASRRRSP